MGSPVSTATTKTLVGGFWLPSYESNFFNTQWDSEFLHNLQQDCTNLALPKDKKERLDVSTFRRLMRVLPCKGYSTAFPIIHETRQHIPSGVVYIFDKPATLLAGNTAASSITNLVLLVDAHGFFIWTAFYQDSRDEEILREALKRHIAELVGGDFCSHKWIKSSDVKVQQQELVTSTTKTRPKTDKITDKSATKTIDNATINEYRDKDLGILTFSQLNTVLEGLFNANLDFRIFFETPKPAADKADEAPPVAATGKAALPASRPNQGKTASVASLSNQEDRDEEKRAYTQGIFRDEYSVGKFIEKIVALSTPDQLKKVKEHLDAFYENREHKKPARTVLATKVEFSETVPKDFMEAYNAAAPAFDFTNDKLINFANWCRHSTIEKVILDQFLEATSLITLQKLKKRIERCRRALLGALIEVTHRRTPLEQAETPDDVQEVIDGINEAQIRGYVMFFAAKFPLITNVELHLKDLHPDELPPFQSWSRLLTAIKSDISGLNEAINQARTDRMLYEQEQIHSEQETLSEIERLNSTTDTGLASSTSFTISLAANLLALFALAFTIISYYNNNKKGFPLPDWGHIVSFQNIPIILGYVLAFFAITGLYFGVTHLIMEPGARWFLRILQRNRGDAKNYYEMDIQIDAPLKHDVVKNLYERGMPEPEGRGSKWNIVQRISRARKLHPIKKVQRNSYRIERFERDEALHKIYVEARFKISPPTKRFRSHYIKAALVYELMFHRPSLEEGYVFRGIRFISTHDIDLKADEIGRLKTIVLEHFVNPCLINDWQLLTPNLVTEKNLTRNSLDALMTFELEQDSPVDSNVNGKKKR